MWEDSLPSLSSVGIEIKEPTVEAPESFSSRYKEDFDILKAHRFVLYKLETRMKNSRIKSKISNMEKELPKKRTIVQKKNLLQNIEKLKRKERRLTTLIRDYNESVKEVLEKYSKIGPLDKVLLFSPKEEKKIESEEEKEYRQRLIFNYIHLASKYYKINAVWEGEDILCEGCGTELSHEVADEFTSTACENCGVERKRLAKVPVSSNNAKDNINRNNYEERKNFLKAVERFQGKQVMKNTGPLFRDLDDFFVSYGMKKGEEIKKLPLDVRGRKEGTSKQLMFKALNEKGYSHCYKNINLICHLYWGWSLPDISELEEGLKDDYNKFQEVYEKMKTGRKSCLNADYMLLVLLLKQGYRCAPDDFKIVRTDEIFEEYEDIRRRVCAELQWKFHNLL